MEKKHFVSIIIVNYNGRELLDTCLASLKKIDYPKDKYEVIVVDNHSSDDSAVFVHKHYPEHYLIRNETNLGFSGGNAIGLRYANGEYIVLLNTDVIVERNWLSSLVRAAEKPEIGIVNSKLYFSTPFLELSLTSSQLSKSDIDGGTDFSPRGVLLENIICMSKRNTELVSYESGFYKCDNSGIVVRWSNGDSRILLPFDDNFALNEYKITLHSPTNQKEKTISYEIKLAEKILSKGTLSFSQVQHISLKIPISLARRHFIWLVQNAGNVVFSDGYGKDRGSQITRREGFIREFYERDNPYFDKPAQLLAFCGASCLIRRKVIESVGFFDEKYYMYYEDLDLSLRAWLYGWDIVFEPTSIAFHKHRASSASLNTSFMLYHVEKNHIFFLLTFYPFTLAFIEFGFICLRLFVNFILMQAYYYRDNLPKSEQLRQKHEARTQAVRTIVGNLSYFLRKRRSIQYLRPDGRIRLFQMMY